MVRPTDKRIKYKNGQLPEELGNILGNADDSDLKILIALMMASNADGRITDGECRGVSQSLGLTEGELEASLKFWRGAGVLENVSGAERKSAAKPEENTDKALEKTPEGNSPQAVGIQTAHRNGALEQSNGISVYNSGELASIFEKRKVTGEFVDEAQRVFGRTFNTYDTGIIVGLIDQLGFDEEAVLSILAYAKRRGRTTLRYCEKLAIGLYDEGYTETKQIQERLSAIERMGEMTSQIKQLFGMGSRALSKTEKQLLERWTVEFGYDMDVIMLAYDITVDSIQKPVPKYTGSILEKWNSEGLRTAEDVSAYIKKDKENRGAENGKSYDLDDFFEAAIKRSCGDLR